MKPNRQTPPRRVKTETSRFTEATKIQGTLRGRSAWAFQSMMTAKGQTNAHLSSEIVDRWIDANRELIKRDYGVDLADYENFRQLQQAEQKGLGGIHPLTKAEQGNA